jgi:integrase
VRNFLSYLAVHHPEIKHLDQLRRDPHILGWMSRLHAQKTPLATASYINLLVALRAIVNDLAWTNKSTELARLIRREDIPRAPQKLPRPLSAEQDQLLQQEFLRRNDFGANAFLLIRHTGMRIGECADLSWDCLRSTGPNQWAIHVPLGKLKTQRMVPVDAFVSALVQRLRFFRSLDPLPPDGRLLARPGSKNALVHQLRDYMHQVCYALNLSTRIVPHQFRHYVPFRTMSRNEGDVADSIGKNQIAACKGPSITRHSPIPAKDRSGSPMLGHQVYSASVFHAETTSSPVPSPYIWPQAGLRVCTTELRGCRYHTPRRAPPPEHAS